MSSPNYEEQFNSTGYGTKSPVVNSDVFVDNVPVDAALVHETPMGGTVASVGPMNNELVTDAIPMYETPITETPVVEPAATVGSMYDLRGDNIPMYETPVKEVPMVGSAAAVELKDEAIAYQAPAVEAMPYNAPVVEAVGHEVSTTPMAASSAPLLSHEDSEHFRTQWNEIQGKFVDEPRTAVQQADALVSEVVTQITQMFATEHSALESQWKQGNDVSTEDLRKALQRYRSFFNRLVV